MKKIILSLSLSCLLFLCAAPVLGAEAPAVSDLQVQITSPAAINATPVHDDTITMAVTNTGTAARQNLFCYLTVVDMGRGQTYPVDEFGPDAYQTRTIASLAPGETATVAIPVHILYVGQYRFTASVLDAATSQVTTGPALTVLMTAVSHLDKGLVQTVAAAMPVLLAAAAFLMIRGQGQRTV